MASYLNSFHRPGALNPYGPAEYTTNAKPVAYRGLLIYRRLTEVYDIVHDGVCIGQYAGPNGARQAIDTRFAHLCSEAAS